MIELNVLVQVKAESLGLLNLFDSRTIGLDYESIGRKASTMPRKRCLELKTERKRRQARNETEEQRQQRLAAFRQAVQDRKRDLRTTKSGRQKLVESPFKN